MTRGLPRALIAMYRRAVSSGAAALSSEPLDDMTDPVVRAKLRALHPQAGPPAVVANVEPTLKISAETLIQVYKRVSAYNRGTAGGPPAGRTR